MNYDLPDEAESYVHRIGRTGRNGVDGIAITLCDPSENSKLRAVERIIRLRLPIVADHTREPDPKPSPRDHHAPAANENDGARRDHHRNGNPGQRHGFGGKPAQHGKPGGSRPDGERKPFRGNNKRRFGGKRPAARAA